MTIPYILLSTEQKQYQQAIRAPSSEFVSLSIPSWQILTAHAQSFRGARDLAFSLKVPLDSLLVWASSEGSGETARMRRLAWTFAARIGDKYQIRLTRSIKRIYLSKDKVLFKYLVVDLGFTCRDYLCVTIGHKKKKKKKNTHTHTQKTILPPSSAGTISLSLLLTVHFPDNRYVAWVMLAACSLMILMPNIFYLSRYLSYRILSTVLGPVSRNILNMPQD